MCEPNQNQQSLSYLHEYFFTIGVEEDVGGFEIPVDNTLHMTFSDSCQHLIEEFFDLEGLHHFSSKSLHVGPQILVEIFEDEVELFLVDDNIFQAESIL